MDSFHERCTDLRDGDNVHILVSEKDKIRNVDHNSFINYEGGKKKYFYKNCEIESVQQTSHGSMYRAWLGRRLVVIAPENIIGVKVRPLLSWFKGVKQKNVVIQTFDIIEIAMGCNRYHMQVASTKGDGMDLICRAHEMPCYKFKHQHVPKNIKVFNVFNFVDIDYPDAVELLEG